MGRFVDLLIYLSLWQMFLPCAVSSDWSKWSEWSDCSRTCDGGAAYQQRKCLGVTENSCFGENMRYKICKNKPCPEGSPNFRAQQCSSYNEVPFHNKLYRWLPYYDPKRKCSLRCKAKGFNFVATLAPKVLDGTKCDEKKKDICINGQCMVVGCDDVLGSSKSVDKCGLCGGDGSGCKSNVKKRDRFKWQYSGYTGCSVTCGTGIQKSVPLCVDSSSKFTGVDKKHCSHLEKPIVTSRKCYKPRCVTTKWFTGHWQPCSKTCDGGIERRYVYCVDEGDGNGSRRRVHNTMCPSPRPPMTKPCNVDQCPTWYAGEWSPCTATCGDGKQYREVICRQMRGEACNNRSKPEVVRKCASAVTCHGAAEKAMTTTQIILLRDDDRQEIKLANTNSQESRERGNPKASTSPSYVVSNWSPCSVTCGTGVKIRSVICQVYLTYLSTTDNLPDGDCDGHKPSTEKWCYAGSCNNSHEAHRVDWNVLKNGPNSESYNWRYGEFTPCSKTCLRGRQDSMVDCVRNLDNSVVDRKFCSPLPGLHTVSRVCNDKPCPPRWQFGQFGSCSVKCGRGIRRRPVYCIQQMAPGDANILRVDEKTCLGDRPKHEEGCNDHPCPAKWRSEKWSECSVPCGEGLQTRDVICEKLLSPHKYLTVPEIECPDDDKPAWRRWCVTDCTNSVPKIRIQNSTFIQFTSTKKIKLKVGGSALILPGATVVIRCPVKRYNKKLLYWMHGTEIVPSVGRVKVLKNGALRIRKAKEHLDGGRYSCIASGAKASIEIKFQTVSEADRKARIRHKYLNTVTYSGKYNSLFKQTLKNRTHRLPWQDQPSVVEDSSHGKIDPAQTMFVAADWSPCSRTCGGEGIQQRKVTCEEISVGFTRIISYHKCMKKGLTPPESERRCFAEKKCPYWTVGEWSPCSEQDCVFEGYSIQQRTVICSFHNTSVAKNIQCYPNTRPLNRRECPNKDCNSVWETSKWSQCTPPCSGKGKKSRMLFCVWEKSGLPAGVNCRKKPRPEVMKPCKTVLCSLGNCSDASRHCSLVKMLRMCRYNNFKRRCCKTCSDWVYEPIT